MSENIIVHFDEEQFKIFVTDPLMRSCCVREIASQHILYNYKPDSITYWLLPRPKWCYESLDREGVTHGLQIDFYDGETLVQSNQFPFADIASRPTFDFPAIPPVRNACTWNNYQELFVLNYYHFLPENLGTVVDIGANVGLVTELFKQKGARRCYLIDADSRNCATLDERFKNDTVIHAACSGKKDPSLTFYKEEENSTISSLEPAKGRIAEEVININLTKLFRDYNIESADLVKIDIEGAEYELFQNEEHAVFNRIKHLVIEAHNTPQRDLHSIINIPGFSFKGFYQGNPVDILNSNYSLDIFATNEKYNE